MLTLGKEQWRKLEALRREDFIRQLTAYLMARFGANDSGLGFEVIQTEVEKVIRVGEAWGMRSSRLLTQHVVASRVIGHDYAEVSAETGSVVKSTRLDDDTKARWLELWLESIRQHQLRAR